MGGRKPTPTALKIVRGNPGKRPINQNEPKPRADAEMPDWLSPQAQAHWPLIAKQLREAGILTEIDATALGQFCEVFARWRHASDLMGERLLVKSPNGFLMQSPLLPIVNHAHEQMVRMLTEFGMTPSSRTRVTSTKPTEADAFAKFVKKG